MPAGCQEGGQDPSRGRPRGGSGTPGGGTTSRRALRHGPRGPRPRRRNRRGGTGTATACRREVPGRSAPSGGGSGPGSSSGHVPVGRAGQGAEHRDDVVAQLRGPVPDGVGTGGDQQGTGRHEGWCGSVEVGAARPEPAAQPVAHHRTAEPAGEGVAEARGPAGIVVEVDRGERTPTDLRARLAEGDEGAAIADRDDQADSRARPLDRRLRTMARPARVDMRWRKPWRLARFRTLG